MVAEPIPAQPQTLDLNIAGLPDDMTSRDQWVCWRWETVDGRRTKVPISARTGNRASATDRATWAPFATACDYLEWNSGKVDGLGYVFAADDPFTGIDLDKAADPETGELDPDAQAIVDRFDSFTERSISGTGAHIIIRGTVPPGGNRRGRVEMYDSGRFFVMSGHVIRNPNQIADRSDELARFHAETFPPAARAMGPLTDVPLTVTEDDLLERCMGNHKFRRLFDGDDGDYGDDASSADLAFCNILVRNGATRDQVDVIYRRSNRARPKWDQRRGDRTYGERTIDEAFDGTVIPISRERPAHQLPKPTLRASEQVAHLVEESADCTDVRAQLLEERNRRIALEQHVAALSEWGEAQQQRAEQAETRARTWANRARMFSADRDRKRKIIQNANIGAERFTAVALVDQFAKRKEQADEKGFIPLPSMTLARNAGFSGSTALSHVKRLVELGALRKEVRVVGREVVDPDTGEIYDQPRKVTFVAPAENVTDFADAVAKLASEKKANHGGDPRLRRQCADHPDAPVLIKETVTRKTTWSCSTCKTELDTKNVTLEASEQVAHLVDGELLATGTENQIAISGRSSPRGRSFMVAKTPSCHNGPTQLVIEPDAGTVAAEWMRPKETPGVDRWTQ